MSKPMRHKDLSLSTYKLTISTKQSLSDEDIKVLSHYVKNKCVASYGVCEFGASDKRHAHFILICKEPCIKRNLCDRAWRIIRDRHVDSIQKYAVRVDVMYDHTWYDEYLRKEDNRQELFDLYDRNAAESRFPTREQQEQLQAIAAASAHIDTYYADLELHFREYWKRIHRTGKPSIEDVAQFLNNAMFVEQTLRGISDLRRLDQITRHLTKFINKDASIDFQQRRLLCAQKGQILNPNHTIDYNCIYDRE